MRQEQHAEKERELWHHLVERELVYIQTRQDFLNNCTDRIAFIKKALDNPTERGTALRLIEYLKVSQLDRKDAKERSDRSIFSLYSH
jgi:hypothetical protein